MTSEVLLGIMIPFIGTSLGAGMVFFLKNQISENVQKILTGFAARRSGADRFFDHDPCGKCGCAGAAIFSGVRGRRHDVRRRGGTDSGNVRRKALELGDSRIRGWIRADDDPGCGAGMKTNMLVKEIR